MATELCHFQLAKLRVVAVVAPAVVAPSEQLYMGKLNFLISIDKKVHIFINSLPIALHLVPK